MNSKILRSTQILFVVVASVLFWASCAPPKPVKPWDSSSMSKIRLSFTDTDPVAGQIGGDVLLQLNGAPKPNGIDQYVLYWGGSSGESGKGGKIAEVSVNITGDLLYKIEQGTAIPGANNRFFLLFLKKGDGSESYSGISASVVDETQTPEQKAETARLEAERQAQIAETARIEAEKREAEEARRAEEKAKLAEEEAKLTEEKAKQEKIAAITAEIVVENVLFDFDRSTLKPEFKQMLNKSFAGVERPDLIKLVISGHADERGSNEYNLALGERRAFAVKRYLISLGLLEENINTVSYGEEKPVDPRRNETAWAKNRRSETDFR